VCGIDVRLADISAPLHPAGPHQAGPHESGPGQAGPDQAAPHGPPPAGAVIELNACPGLRMHLSPEEGTARDVAAAVVDQLYPPGAPSRVPVVAVTGTNGKTTTVRMIGHILGQSGLRVGMATTDGVYCGGSLVYHADASGPRSARMVLDDTSVEAAVLETARGGIIRGGLGYDQADVAVVTNITADHLGSDGIDHLGELTAVKALVAEEIKDGGAVVLNADDPVTAALADRPAVRRHAPDIRYFSLDPGSELAARHRRAGGLVYTVAGGQLVESSGSAGRPLMELAGLPGAFGGRAPHLVANALAAIAACRALGVSAKDIRQALATFTPAEANPGRGNVFLAGGCPVVVDYGHNAAALAATGAMIGSVWGGRPAAAVTLPGDRRDDLIAASAAAIARWFGAVAVYEDSDRRGRRPGQMQEMIMAELRRARPGIRCVPARSPQDALRAAVTMAGGHPVLFVHESFSQARAALAAIGAEPARFDEPAADEPTTPLPLVSQPGPGH
jgi:cyanophycin synthetase